MGEVVLSLPLLQGALQASYIVHGSPCFSEAACPLACGGASVFGLGLFPLAEVLYGLCST